MSRNDGDFSLPDLSLTCDLFLSNIVTSILVLHIRLYLFHSQLLLAAHMFALQYHLD